MQALRAPKTKTQVVDLGVEYKVFREIVAHFVGVSRQRRRFERGAA